METGESLEAPVEEMLCGEGTKTVVVGQDGGNLSGFFAPAELDHGEAGPVQAAADACWPKEQDACCFVGVEAFGQTPDRDDLEADPGGLGDVGVDAFEQVAAVAQ